MYGIKTGTPEIAQSDGKERSHEARWMKAGLEQWIKLRGLTVMERTCTGNNLLKGKYGWSGRFPSDASVNDCSREKESNPGVGFAYLMYNPLKEYI